MNIEFALEILNMGRMEAAWFTPAVVLYRLQRAYMERQGEDQKWAKTAGDKMREQYTPEELGL